MKFDRWGAWDELEEVYTVRAGERKEKGGSNVIIFLLKYF